jgi:hypothetical protein
VGPAQRRRFRQAPVCAGRRAKRQSAPLPTGVPPSSEARVPGTCLPRSLVAWSSSGRVPRTAGGSRVHWLPSPAAGQERDSVLCGGRCLRCAVDLGVRGGPLRQTQRVLRVYLEVRVLARVAQRGIDVLAYGVYGAGLPDAGGCGEVLAGTELPRNYSRQSREAIEVDPRLLVVQPGLSAATTACSEVPAPAADGTLGQAVPPTSWPTSVSVTRQSVGPENPISTPPGARTMAMRTPSMTVSGGFTGSAPAARAAS